MEISSYISIKLIGKTSQGNLNPKDIDIAETKELLADVETLLFPTKAEKEERPRVSYEVLEGSVKNLFFIPAANVIMFTALMSEVDKQGNTDLLQQKAAAVIDKWQKKAFATGREYTITSSVNETPFLIINRDTKFIAPQTDWVNTNLYLYGEIFEEGGLSSSNLHILTDRYGKLTVDATKEQLTSGTNKLYNIYGLWVKGKQNVATGFLKDLSLIDFLTHQLDYDELALNKLIEKASVSWKKVNNKDAWLRDVKGGVNE
ncbi:MAG: hypothetical protein ABI685_13810 [Ferruginibacter sp.]